MQNTFNYQTKTSALAQNTTNYQNDYASVPDYSALKNQTMSDSYFGVVREYNNTLAIILNPFYNRAEKILASERFLQHLISICNKAHNSLCLPSYWTTEQQNTVIAFHKNIIEFLN
ncbi:MAG: hypothetical protein FWB72_03720 [Firmicutes bacterium]|nr:hypothetical protein [Bacillota bacterium]